MRGAKQPKCISRFYLERNHMVARTFRKKTTTTKSCLFGVIFYVYTITWTTDKELERVFENKGDEFRREKNMEIQSDGEKIKQRKRPARSGQQG